MEYKIVTVAAMWSFDTRVEELTKVVNEQISMGWEPLGAPVAVEHRLSQAMIKRR